jgi:O-antigen/teichoic acid export membrane protein
MGALAMSLTAKGLLLATAGLVAAWSTRAVLPAVLAMAVVVALVLVAWDAPHVRGGQGAVSDEQRPPLLGLAWLSLPLGLTVFISSLNTSVPLYVLEAWHGEAVLGRLAAMLYLVLAPSAVVSSWGQAVMPRLASHHAHGERWAFRRLTRRAVAWTAALGVVGVVLIAAVGPALLGVIYGEAYASGSRAPFTCLMTAGALGLVASALGQAVTATRAFSRLLLPSLAVAAITAAASLALAPRFGVLGTCGAMVVANASACVAMAWVLLRHGDVLGPDSPATTG